MALSIYSITTVKNGETAPYCHIPELGGHLHTGSAQCTTCSQHVCKSHSIMISSSSGVLVSSLSSSPPSLHEDQEPQQLGVSHQQADQNTIVLCMPCFSTQYPASCAVCASGIEQDTDEEEEPAYNTVRPNSRSHFKSRSIKACYQRCEDCGIALCPTHIVEVTACTEADIAEWYPGSHDDAAMRGYISSNHNLCDTCFEAHVFMGDLPFC